MKPPISLKVIKTQEPDVKKHGTQEPARRGVHIFNLLGFHLVEWYDVARFWNMFSCA